MKRLFWVALAVLALSSLGRLEASTITFNVILSGSESVPVNMVPGSGSATVIIDDVADTVWVDLSYTGLTAPATNAHIHCCTTPDMNTGVVIPFIPAGFTTGATSGTFMATFTGVSPDIITGLEHYLGYINIHTANFPGGEIRGDMVPEPGTVLLLSLGLLGLATLKRKVIARR